MIKKSEPILNITMNIFENIAQIRIKIIVMAIVMHYLVNDSHSVYGTRR